MSSPAPSSRPAGRADEDVELTDLEIIRRYSLATRQGSARRSEVLAALRSDLDRLERSSRSRPSTPATRPSPQSTADAAQKPRPTKRAPAKRSSRG